MESTKLFLPLLFMVSLMAGQGLGDRYSLLRQPFEGINKLFVFGDSYVDTGNEMSGVKYPYGITFPGKPDGRFSDGYVLTDYFASFLSLKSPIPYLQLHDVENPKCVDGVNFAFGGTGAMDTGNGAPNLTMQIELLHELIDNSTFSSQEIESSLALVSVSGNDYLNYILKKDKDFESFAQLVVNNITVDLKRLHSFGVKKVMITALGPIECVPAATVWILHLDCLEIMSGLANYHNKLLQEAVTKLNDETIEDPSFYNILDIHAAFSYIIQNKGYPAGNITFATPLKPCCWGFCGEVDKPYGLCEDPKSAFYWDAFHPTHQGWLAAFSYLTDRLKQSWRSVLAAL